MIKQYLIFLIATTSTSISLLSGHSHIVGEGGSESQSFSFPLSCYAYHPRSGILFTAAGTSLSDQAASHSVSFTNPEDNITRPLTGDEKLIVNHEKEQANPLRGAPIRCLHTLDTYPVVVTETDPSSVHVIMPVGTMRYLSARIQDKNPVDIVALTSLNRISEEGSILLMSGCVVYALIKPAQDTLGSEGTSIAVLPIAQKNAQDKNLYMVHALTIPLDTKTLWSRNKSVTSCTSPIIIHCAPEWSRQTTSSRVESALFVGTIATSDDTHEGGAHSIVVSKVTTEQTSALEKLLPDTCVSSDSIIATDRPYTSVYAHHIKTMRTTTGLSYLVVVGGVGDKGSTKQSVYALPAIPTTGKLAHVHAPLVSHYTAAGKDALLLSREFTAEPTTPADLYTAESPEAQVGAGPAHAPITSLHTSGDAIFITTAQAGNGEAPGLWHSQAICDTQGKIVCWTPWRRAGGPHAVQPLFGCAVDAYSGNLLYMTGSDDHHITNIYRTTWSQQGSLAFLVNSTFTPEDGGLRTITSWKDTLGESLLIAAQRNRILIAKTEECSPLGIRQPRATYKHPHVSTDGSLGEIPITADHIICSGGDLDRIGAIKTVAVIYHQQHFWIAAGGEWGVALLGHKDGTGIMRNEYGALDRDHNLVWKKIETAHPTLLQGAHKLCTDGQSCYVMTRTHLTKFPLTQATLAAGSQTPLSVLAQAKTTSCKGLFTDCVVLPPCIILATSNGLLRTGTGYSCLTAHSMKSMHWTEVPLGDRSGPLTQLTLQGPVYLNPESFRADCYVLNSEAVRNITKLYRLALVHDGPLVTDTTVSAYHDELAKEKATAFLTKDTYETTTATDGSVLLFGTHRSSRTNARLVSVPPVWHQWPYTQDHTFNRLLVTGRRSEFSRAGRVLVSHDASNSIYAIARDIASGAWLIPGDRGLISNE